MVEVPEPVALPVITLPIPNIVIVPRVVVRVVDPLVIVETTTDVLIAEDVVVVGTVIVDSYERYDPVGVVSVAPVKIITLWEESCAFAAMAKRQPTARRFEENMVVVLASMSPLRALQQPAARADVCSFEVNTKGGMRLLKRKPKSRAWSTSTHSRPMLSQACRDIGSN